MKKLPIILAMLLFSATCYGWSDNDYTNEEKAIVADALIKAIYDIDGNGVVDSVDTGSGTTEVADGVTITGTGTIADPFVAVGGSGDVTGPSSVTNDGNIVVFDGATGKIIKDGGAPPTDGADGTDGVDGYSVLSVAGVPGIGAGVDGDYCINTLTHDIYGPKTAGAWGSPTSLIGPQGDDGSPGATGDDGTDGNTILYGTINPTTEGVDGDFYINTYANTIFGPKATTWPSGVSLVGPQGIPGDQGEAGPNTVSTSTTTNITGLLKGNGTTVEADTTAYVSGTPWTLMGYLTAETDPSVDTSAEIQAIIGASVYEPAGITESDISDLQSYLTAETDPDFALWLSTFTDQNTTYTATDFDIKDLTDSTSLRSTWSGKQDALSAADTDTSGYLTYTDWNTFNNKQPAGSYLTSETSHSDVVQDGDFTSQGIMLRGASSGTYSILTNNSANWNTAYGWGDHAGAGYVTGTPWTGMGYYIGDGSAFATAAQGGLAESALQAEVDGSTTNEINTVTGDNSTSTTGLSINILGAGLVTTAVSGDTMTITGTGDGTGTDDQTASEVSTSTTNFEGILTNDATSDTTQECLDKIDDHTHTGATISGIDISDDTNLAGTANEIVLTGDTLSLHADIARDSELHSAAALGTFADKFLSLTGQQIDLELTDPNADRAVIWDDDPGVFAWLDYSSFLTSVPDSYLLNTGDVGTGTYDFGAADDFEVPNGANPTVDTAGQVAVDSSAAPGSGIRFYGDAAYTLAGTYSKSFMILSPVATDDYPIWCAPYAITIKRVRVQCLGGTNIVGQLTECDGEGINAAVVDDSDITAAANNSVDDDGTLSNPSIDAGDYCGWKTESISGTPTSVTVTFDYTINQVN